MNSSHHRIFKCIGFVSSHYVSVINLNVVCFFANLIMCLNMIFLLV